MNDKCDVLFELGTEELPPKSLLKLINALHAHVDSGLRKAGLHFSEILPYATPRRLALVIRNLDVAQPDQELERKGPATSAAYMGDGTPSKALEGFLRSCGANANQLSTLETDKGSWLVCRQTVKGQGTADLLPEIINQALTALPIAKRMRWGNGVAEFVRPVHWVVLLFGKELVEAEILGIHSGRNSRGHRFHGAGSLAISSPDEYVDKLRQQGYVLADFAQRRQKVEELAREAAARVGGQALIDADLLDEVTALVEWPVSVLGGFDSRFLDLPAEVLITTMQANQKYFPVLDSQGKMLPYFITISNLESSRAATVREGNERVVRPRLSDAEFFWNQDRKRTLESRVDDLGQVTFQKKLGSLLDKTHRVRRLASAIAHRLGQEPAPVDRAALIAKADLLTAMVGEFPELQGIMGRYYALAEGEPDDIATAIEEQYLPKVSGGSLPASQTGRILALAEKLDSLSGIFSTGLIPTGDKDPYALRRAALGMIRILIEARIDLDVPELLDTALGLYEHDFDVPGTKQLVHNFILERLRGYLIDGGCRPDEFEAVLAVRPASLVDFQNRLQAVREFRQLPEAASLSAANKRIRNLLRKTDESIDAGVDESVLLEPSEQRLFAAAREARESITPFLYHQSYTEALRRLAALREPVDAFFDAVMVMADDDVVRRNRLSLLGIIDGLFINIADISSLQD